MSLDFIPAHLEQIPGMLMADAALALDRQSHSWSSLELALLHQEPANTLEWVTGKGDPVFAGTAC